MIFALAGNQNCGKTTLFNQLTGSNQHVGNFPGVTVDRKSGIIRGYPDCEVVDLPGIYSIRPYTGEEIVTRNFLIDSKPDGIINIVDATNIERNLYLTLQLLELQIPMVLALNMMDEVRNNGGTINVEELSKRLGIPVVPISAFKNEGVDELIQIAVKQAQNRIPPKKVDFCEGAVHRCVHAVTHLIEDHAQNMGISPRFAATKLIEDDPEIITRLKLNNNEYDMLEHSVTEMEHETGMDRNAAMADMRYTFIESVCADTVVKCHESKEHIRSVKIDSVLTNKYLAIPLFIIILLTVFKLTFDVIGAALSDLLAYGIDSLSALVDRLLTDYGLNPIVHSLVIDGIFAGVGSVLSFLPVIVVLFFFLSLLEDSGYMARIAFVMDKLLRKIGLSGRSFVPMLIGFGCTVPAVMATRTLSSERDRKMTIYLTPSIRKLGSSADYTFVLGNAG
ncbi:MAG: ferrous iron transport protein B, partial [Oscillospiraceae bacterium]